METKKQPEWQKISSNEPMIIIKIMDEDYEIDEEKGPNGKELFQESYPLKWILQSPQLRNFLEIYGVIDSNGNVIDDVDSNMSIPLSGSADLYNKKLLDAVINYLGFMTSDQFPSEKRNKISKERKIYIEFPELWILEDKENNEKKFFKLKVTEYKDSKTKEINHLKQYYLLLIRKDNTEEIYHQLTDLTPEEIDDLVLEEKKKIPTLRNVEEIPKIDELTPWEIETYQSFDIMGLGKIMSIANRMEIYQLMHVCGYLIAKKLEKGEYKKEQLIELFGDQENLTSEQEKEIDDHIKTLEPVFDFVNKQPQN